MLSQYDKQRVARYFGRAAANYTAHDHLQRAIAEQLFAKIQPVVPATAVALDVGCGPAHHKQRLSSYGGYYLGLDLAAAMLDQAQQQQGPDIALVAADMEQLPLAEQSVGLLFSNLAMQWSNDVTALLREWLRVLEPGGQVIASTVLAGSLQPLGDCFAAIDGHVHTNQWDDFASFAAKVNELPWQVQCAQQTIVQEFPSVEAMLRELKGVGANYTARSETGLFGRERFKRLKHALEEHRNSNGQLELHWQIGVLYGRKSD